MRYYNLITCIILGRLSLNINKNNYFNFIYINLWKTKILILKNRKFY